MSKLIKGLKALFGFPFYLYKSYQLQKEMGIKLNDIIEIERLQDAMEKLKGASSLTGNSIVIFCVFILRENILFLEEWIQHHLDIGVDHFVLYDNSCVSAKARHETRFEDLLPGKVNKFGINYTNLINEADARVMLDEILNKYQDKITVISWNRKHPDGSIGYFQKEAVRDFISKYWAHFRYALHIDMDEFMISRKGYSLKDIVSYMQKNGITSLFIKQKFFENRFSIIDSTTLRPKSKVRGITKCLNGDRKRSEKTLFEINYCPIKNAAIHLIYTTGKNDFSDSDMLIDYHYRFHFEIGDYDYDRLNLETGEDFITEDRDALKYLKNEREEL